MDNTLMVLQIRFEKNGFLYWQICRTDKAAIYEQKMLDGRRVFYEVWKIRTQPAKQRGDIFYPAQERRPSTIDWGKFGWTYYTLQEARKRYDLINGRDSVPDEPSDRVLSVRATAHPYPAAGDVGPWPGGSLKK
jgi:hypothetical protein